MKTEILLAVIEDKTFNLTEIGWTRYKDLVVSAINSEGEIVFMGSSDFSTDKRKFCVVGKVFPHHKEAITERLNTLMQSFGDETVIGQIYEK